MDRSSALVLSILFFIFFWTITYYGAQVTLWSSIIFATFVGLILLNLFYPISEATTDDADWTLGVYAVLEIVGIILLAIYIAHGTLSTSRNICHNNDNI